MPRYELQVRMKHIYAVVIDADDEESAIEKFDKAWVDYEFEPSDYPLIWDDFDNYDIRPSEADKADLDYRTPEPIPAPPNQEESLF